MKGKNVSKSSATEDGKRLFLKVLEIVLTIIFGGLAIGFVFLQFGGQSINIHNESGHTEINYNTYYREPDTVAVTDETVEEDCSIRIVSYINNQILLPNIETLVEPGDKIHLFAESIYDIERMGYFYDSPDEMEKIHDFFEDHVVITVPTGIPGSTHTLYVEAIAEYYYDVTSDYFRTGWIPFSLKYTDWT